MQLPAEHCCTPSAVTALNVGFIHVHTACDVPHYLVWLLLLLQAYGVINGASSPGYNLSDLASIPPAEALGRTVTVLGPDGSILKNALRLNGAAVKPVCGF